MMKKKRILWVINHKTLIQFEVPLLRQLGYEVYIPKKPPFDESIVVDWESDKLLTIPQKDIDKLNDIDFYEKSITSDSADVINQYFDIAMFIHTPVVIESLVDRFYGVLVLRAYGRPDAHGSYTDVIISSLGIQYLNKIQMLGNRFVFGESYRGLSTIECDYFQNHTLYMPIGMPHAIVKDQWTGEIKKGLYICPRIKSSGYYETIYKNFKKNFKEIPFDIGGVQPIRVLSDPNVLGYLPQDQYDKIYPAHAFLLYDNQDKNHITYPPLEAIRCGLPVLFLADGMLDKLGGRDLPGRCRNIVEAKKKAQLLLAGNKSLIKQIRKTQSVILKSFTMEYCLPHWRKSMMETEKFLQCVLTPMFGKKKKRLGIVLPEGFTGGVLDYTFRIIRAIQLGASEVEDDIEIIFAHVNHVNFDERDYFKPIRDLGIQVRSFDWKMFGYADVKEMFALMGISSSALPVEQYCMIADGITYMNDCDMLLLTSDRLPAAFLSMQPYGIIAHDYIQRLRPEIFGLEFIETTFLQAVRCAKAVFTSTPITLKHAINYAGVTAQRIHQIPVPFSIEDDTFKNIGSLETIGQTSYFLWSTNATPHKNHKIALQGLSSYYAHGGKLRCIVTGVQTNYLDYRCRDDSPKVFMPYVSEIRNMIKADENLKKHLKFKGELSKTLYRQVLEGAAFVFHPGTADNGNGTAFDAAYFGVPTVSSDYAAMRYYDEYFMLGMQFFDPKDPDDIAHTLLNVESNLDALKNMVPSRVSIESKMIESKEIYLKIYEIFKEYLAIC